MNVPSELFRPVRIGLTVVGFLSCAGVLGADSPDSAEGKTPPRRSGATTEPMTNARLDRLIHRLDEHAVGEPGFWKIDLDGQRVSVITDERADRMRIILPVAEAGELGRKALYRLMQSNFDSALDARYAIAKDVLWSAFIHPLSVLTDKEFLSGLGQVMNLAASYGTSYSSGALIFRGGDSEQLQRRDLIDRLMKKGLEM